MSRIENEFSEFSKDSIETPRELDMKVMGFVQNELDPSHSSIFAKLLTIHTVVGALSMAICPQFEMSLTNRHELFHFFHHTFGQVICHMICGAIFLGTGALVAAFLMSREEILKIWKISWLYYTGFSLIAVSAFLFLGVETYLSVVSYWAIGAVTVATAIVGLSARVHAVSKSTPSRF